MPNPTALVTLPDVYAHLNIPSGNQTPDLSAKLQGFIDAATVYVQNFTGPIIPTTYTEIRNGGGGKILVDNPPILTVTSVTEYLGPVAYPLTQVTYQTTDVGAYSFSIDDAEAGIITRRTSGNLVSRFSSGTNNVVIVYVAGRTSVAADIRLAVLQDIAGLYGPGQLGNSPYGNQGEIGNTPLNPIGLFPRVAAILSAPSMRTPAIG